MNNQPPLQDGNSSILSSTSSYSQIIPRQQIIFPIRRDKPIVIKSIPINKQRLSCAGLNHKQNSYKTLSDSNLFDSKNLSTKVQSLNYGEEQNNNGNPKSQSEKSIKLSVNGQFQQDEVIQKQQQQNALNNDHCKEVNKKQNEQRYHCKSQQKLAEIQKQKYQTDNAILNYSMSSFASQKPIQMSPNRQSFEWNILNSNSKKNNLNNQNEQKLVKQQKQSSSKLFQEMKSLQRKNKQLETRLRQLGETLKNEQQNFDLQRKANEIYTEFYDTLSKVVLQFFKMNKSSIDLGESQLFIQPLNESMNMQKIIQTVTKLIESYSNNLLDKNKDSIQREGMQQRSVQTELFPFQQIQQKNQQHKESNLVYIQKINNLQRLIQQVNQRNIKLKNDLLQSTQNNINAIFNTQMSASCCFENQVKKINNQMGTIKQKINLILLSNQNNQNHPQYQYPQPHLHPQIIYLPQPTVNYQPTSLANNNNNHKKQVSKIVKIYTTKDKVYQQSQSQQSHGQEQKRNKKRQHSLSRRKHKRNSSSKSQKSLSSSSLSSKSTKKRQQMSRKQIQQLKQAYNQTKNQLNALINTFSMINSSQNEMKGYFRQIKEDFMKEMSVQLQKIRGENEKEKSRKEKEQIQQARKEQQARRRQSQNKRTQSQFEQLIRKKQQVYQSHVDMMQKQRNNDQQLIRSLNKKLIQLTTRISVPQRVNQQLNNNKKFALQMIQEQIPTSEISVSVDWLRLIQQLKKQNTKQKEQMQSLLKSNNFLKGQIQQLTVIKHNQQSRKRTYNYKNNIYHQQQQQQYQYQQCNKNESYSRERKESIINGLNGFSQASIYPTLPIKTTQNFQLGKNKIYHGQVRNTSQQTLQYLQSYVVNHSTNLCKKQKSQHNNKVYYFSSQSNHNNKNHQSNFKVILHSKQTNIKNLQNQVTNLQQTIQYLKQQLQTKQKTIKQLQNYIITLENQSIKSNSVSPHQHNNNQPEINLYMNYQTNFVNDNVKNKYENYVKNLKLLLKQTKNENKFLKQQLQNLQKHPDQLTQSNCPLKNSAAHSQRTTKNFPNSPSPTHPKSQAQILIRKKHQKHQQYQHQRQQQRINIMANQRDLMN